MTKLATAVKGPGRYKIYGKISGGGMFSSTEHFLVVANISKA